MAARCLGEPLNPPGTTGKPPLNASVAPRFAAS